MPDNATRPPDQGSLLARIFGLLLGLSAPLTAFGNAALGIAFGLAVLLSLVALRRPSARKLFLRPLRTRAAGLVAATVAWWSLSAVFSIDPAGSFEVIARVVFFALAFCAVLQGLAELRGAQETAEGGFVLGLACVGMLAVVALTVDTALLRLFKPLSDAPIAPHDMFNSYKSLLAVAMPVVVWIAWRRPQVWIRAAAVLAVVTGMALILGLKGQASFAALGGFAGAFGAIVLLLVAGRMGRLGRAVLVAVFLVTSLAGGIAALSNLPEAPISEAVRENPPLPAVDVHRQAIWGFVLGKALEAPILGHGINAIDKVPGAKEEVLDFNQEYVPAHPHNWFLEILSETGFPGLTLFAVAVVLSMIAVGRLALQGRRGGWAAIAVMGAFWTSSLANFSIWAAWWQIAYLAILALPAAALMIKRR
ncbi:MAG: O-antigen ligase family protein [Alphaproteobacteria bacterium]|nr:O-antigen ligase family protein [Alphaproteobacteria bacterium]